MLKNYWKQYTDDEQWDAYMTENASKTRSVGLGTSYEDDLQSALEGTASFWGGIAFLTVLAIIAGVVAVLV